MAQKPDAVARDLTKNQLVESYKLKLEPQVLKALEDSTQEYAHRLQSNFTEIGFKRKVSSCTAFNAIFVRNVDYILKNPQSLKGIFFTGLWLGILVMILWWNTCSFKDLNKAPNPKRFVDDHMNNILGLSLFLNNETFYSSSMIVVLSIPLMVPVFKRELMNRMYSPTVYFLARLLSSILL
jgi:hypothetical protein